MADESNINSGTYERAYLREKKARKCAEELLEVKSRELFKINRDLEKQYADSQKRTVELELFHELADFIQKDVTTEDALQYFIDVICVSFNWPIAHVFLVDKNDESKIESSKIWHFDKEDKFSQYRESTGNLVCGFDKSLSEKVFASKKSIWIDDVKNSQVNICQSISNEAVKSAFAVPILIYGRIIAVAEFFSLESSILDESLLKIIETAAVQLGTVLERRFSEKQTLENYNELQKTVDKLQQTQTQLVQSEKLASVGQLAAGVAHEINNPIGFVSSNMRTLAEYIAVYKDALGCYESTMLDNKDIDGAVIEKIQEVLTELDVDYINEDIDQLLKDCLDGMTRVQDIVLGLKNFSRVDTDDMELVDVNDCIESTLKMRDNQLKYKADVVSNLSDLPKINCNAGKINQVFTNILVNAGHAIKDQGCITVNSIFDNDNVTVSISDTGAGISKENMKNLFDPFFTTKAVGEGTGLGLSISYGIIQEHNGTIKVDSIVGQGTTFTISLPCASIH